MSTHQNIEERLWNYLDGGGSAEERLFIEQLIATNLEWKTKYQELLELQDLLSHHLELDEPSMRFNQNIMEAISKHHIAPAAKSYINKHIIWSITGFFICSIISLLIAGFSQLNWSAGTADNALSSKLDLSRFANNTYIMLFMVNVVVGLILLDMYLRRPRPEVRSR